MSEHFKKRIKFSRLIILVLQKMVDDGYEPMIGRDGEPHMKNSLHYDGLAMDITLTKDGVIYDKTEDHEAYGRYWESLDPDCYWGGPGQKVDGLKRDGNHYSITFMGKK
jgi:hypothetical protein